MAFKQFPSRTPEEQEDFDQFMAGFREGYPLVGEPQAEIEESDNPHYQEGLHAGKAVFLRDGCPDTLYEEQE